jgi:3-oxoacyl-(acyl-carrier-protein) synthase/acyl carrier protein
MVSVVRADASMSSEGAALLPTILGAVASKPHHLRPIPLSALCLSAGILHDTTVANAPLSALRCTAAAKGGVLSALVDPLVSSHGLSSVTAFSSIAALLHSPGQAPYAAANARLDIWASRAVNAGLPALSTQWGPWAGAGMAAQDSQTRARTKRLGLGLITPAVGLALFQQSLTKAGRGVGSLVYAPLVIPKLMNAMPHLQPLFSSINNEIDGVLRDRKLDLSPKRPLSGSRDSDTSSGEARVIGFGWVTMQPLSASPTATFPNESIQIKQPVKKRSVPRSHRRPSALERGSSSPPSNRPDSDQEASISSASASGPSWEDVAHDVARRVSVLAGTDVGLDDPMTSAGLDSLGAVELRTALERAYGVSLSATVVFDHPTAAALGTYVHEEVTAAAAEVPSGRMHEEGHPNGYGGSEILSESESESESESDTDDEDEIEGEKLRRDDTHKDQDTLTSTCAGSDTSTLRITDVLEEVRRVVQRIMSQDKIADSDPLMEAGLDSLGTVEVRAQLEARFRISLPSTLVFDYPTIREMTTAIVATLETATHDSELSSGSVVASTVTVDSEEGLKTGTKIHRLRVRTPTLGPVSTSPFAPVERHGFVIKIIDVADRTAKDVLGSLRARDAIDLVPRDRWEIDPEEGLGRAHHILGQKAHPHRFGAFIEDPERFDASWFALNRAEVLHMDPQQRLVLAGTASLCSTSTTSSSLPPTHALPVTTSVFLGLSSAEYGASIATLGLPATPFSSAGASLSVAAGRVSFTFGLKSAAVVVDTACSSALVAVQLACRDLLQGAVTTNPKERRDLPEAVAGGVHLFLGPAGMASTAGFQRAGMLSPSGRVRALDADADGYVRAEGLALIRLQRDESSPGPGSRASTSGVVTGAPRAPALGYLVGGHVAQDGRSSSLTAPHGPSQGAVIHGALATAGRTPDALARLQGHLTGTGLGDPVEIGALAATVLQTTTKESSKLDPADRTSPALPTALAVGAGKSWFGHGEPVSGAQSLLHLLFHLRQVAVAPILHLRTPNTHVQEAVEAGSHGQTLRRPVVLPRQGAPAVGDYVTDHARRAALAGVSSFAFQGTIAHLVIETTTDRDVVPDASRGEGHGSSGPAARAPGRAPSASFLTYYLSPASSIRDLDGDRI